MRTRTASFSGLAVAAMVILGGPSAAGAQQVVKLGEGLSLTISGFVNASFFWDRNLFGGFGQGQNAEFAAAPSTLPSRKIISDGDVRNTRLNFTFAGPVVLGNWTPKATIEADFFGAFNGAPPFGDEQPQFRVRFAFVDLTNGRTTLRIGQYWSPMFGETGVSMTHIAFPLGYGAAGDVGWRYPGIFLYHDLTSGPGLYAQLQLAAFKGSGLAAPGPAATAAGGPIGTGEISGLPQFEARLNVGHKTANLTWSGYVVGHVDWKDTTGVGSAANLTSTAVEVGGSVAPGRFTLHGNFYYGRGIGQQFAFITQPFVAVGAPTNPDVRGFGAWAQAGYDFTSHWGVWVFYGLDKPDVERYASDGYGVLVRQLNHDADALIRFRAGRYAVGLEYFRSVMHYSTGITSADQVAISTLFTL
jgi:hypothetical protein